MLYEALVPLGFDPRTIDTMEVVEVASILRRYEDTGDEDDSGPGPRTGERDLIAERMAHARGEGPAPLPGTPRPDPEGASNLGFMDLGRIDTGG